MPRGHHQSVTRAGYKVPLSKKAVRRMRDLWAALRFLLLVWVLQMAWQAAQATRVGLWLIHDLTVGTLVWAIHLISPDLAVQGVGARVVAPGGGIQILNGCDGTEVWFLLVAALLVFPFGWRRRGVGLLLGTLWVFGLNQIRLLALFYAFRQDPVLFNQLHAVVAPIVLILAILAFVAVLKQWELACVRAV